MKLSENWLREWVNPAIDTESLIDQLTMAGLEVELARNARSVFLRLAAWMPIAFTLA